MTSQHPRFTLDSKRDRCIAEARRLGTEGQYYEAMKALQPLMKKPKPDAETLFVAASLCELTKHFDQAITHAGRSLAQFEHPDTLRLIARCSIVKGETDRALGYCDRADAMEPRHLETRCIRGSALERGGRFDEALAVVEPIIREHEARGAPIHPMLSLLWGKILVQFKRFDEAAAYLDGTIADPKASDGMRVEAFHARAKACDRSKNYPAAYAAAKSANAIGELNFQPEIYEEQVSILMEHWSRENMTRFPVSSCRSEVPVFVAGMPRSGTSLIDQIIDAHPKAAGVGELATIDAFARELAQVWDPELEPPASFGRFDSAKWSQAADRYVREIGKLAPNADRIVNKSLGNNRLVGLIARLFPQTRIIHAIRDPRDVAVSCYMGGFNNALHPWTTRIEWVAAAWKQSMRLMEHWKQSLDVPILDVYYENLVRNPEREFPRIIEFLGLEWDEACTRFYESRRTVRTLSYDQVNKPLYTSSAGRHSNYAEFLEGVRFPEYAPPD